MAMNNAKKRIHTVFVCTSVGDGEEWTRYYTSFHDCLVFGALNAPWDNITCTKTRVVLDRQAATITKEIVALLNRDRMDDGIVSFECKGDSFIGMRRILDAYLHGDPPPEEVFINEFDYLCNGEHEWVSHPMFGEYRVWSSHQHPGNRWNPDEIDIRVIDDYGVLLHGKVSKERKVWLKPYVSTAYWKAVLEYISNV